MKTTYRIQDQVAWIDYQDDPNEDQQMLDQLIEELIAPGSEPLQGVIINLSDVEMLNSSGIGLLMKTYKDLLDREIPLVTVVNHYVERTLEMVRLNDIIPTADTEEEAFQLIQNTEPQT